MLIFWYLCSRVPQSNDMTIVHNTYLKKKLKSSTILGIIPFIVMQAGPSSVFQGRIHQVFSIYN